MKMTFVSTIVALALSATAASAATIINGSFEVVDGRLGLTGGGSDGDPLNSLASGTGSGSWDVYDEIPGWTTIAGFGIEVQTNSTLSSIDAYDGEHYVELDSENDGSNTSNSGMRQQFILGPGTYELSFQYSPRTGDIGSNGIGYSLFNGTLLVGGITGPHVSNGTAVGFWTEVRERFTVTEEHLYTLQFNADGTNDELGGFGDAISISAVPLPASALLLLAGLGGLGAVARRKKA